MQRAAAQSHSLSTVRAHYRALAPSYDQKANATCKAAYRELVARVFANSQAVLELGAGSSPLVTELPARRKVACDLSADMLRAGAQLRCTVSDAQRLPFADASFDGVFCINLLEHAPEPGLVLREAARVLRAGGRFLVVTPNGDVEWLLDLLEKLRLKLPEGPHSFLGYDELARLAGDAFRIAEHCRFLAVPVGPWSAARRIDRIAQGGLFQYIACEKR